MSRDRSADDGGASDRGASDRSGRHRATTDGADFRQAMQGVRPIERARRRSFRRREAPDSGAPLPRFHVERQESRFYGLKEGSPETLLEALCSGALKPANRLDLHGMSEAAARERVFRFVKQSRASGLTSIALIHGRGLRSPAGPVLKEALPGWLTQLPLAHEIAAFGSAPVGQGGDGVTLVVLETRR